MYSLKEIAELSDSEFAGNINYNVRYFINDSRAIQSLEAVLFVAIKTGRNNGHAFIDELIERGVKSFLIKENEYDTKQMGREDVSFIVTKDPLKTLQRLAAHHRRKFLIPVIAITGSNGKTVVKEWLYQLLKSDYTICRSPKSYNSQIGVPLSILNLNSNHSLAIFEAGISQPGEMATLLEMIQPTLGVFTSIGTAHDEGFEDRTQKISEKFKLFTTCENIIANGLEKINLPSSLLHKTLVVSEFNDADLKIAFDNGLLSLKSASKTYEFKIPFSDRASFLNAATCAAVLMQMGIKEKEITQRLMTLQAVALRLEIKNGINNSLIINDYYNSDLDSIKIAFNFLQQQNRRAKKIVVVSDIEQSGLIASNLYRQLADLVKVHQIDLLVGIGKEVSSHRSLFKSGSLFFNDTQAFVSQFRQVNFRFSESTILLKGARSFGFEEISRLLQLKSHDTVFEVNLNQLVNNVNYYRSLLQPQVRLMCMVKAMGYGSGSTEISRTLQHIGVDYLAVAYTDEGVELRQSQIKLPIMVMSPEEDAFGDIINYQLEPEIYSFKVFYNFLGQLDVMGISEPYPIHLKIDTGMHRLGFEAHEFDRLADLILHSPQVKIKSVFSHLVGSDNQSLDDFTKEQIRLFEKACNTIENKIGYKVLKHLCNSAGISRFKTAHYDMVRLGIGMYGLGSDTPDQLNLQNIGTLKTRISQIKHVNKGQTVGYNRNGLLEKDTKVATIPIGYADGFSRLLGNGKHGVFINEIFCKTVGNICMDMTMIDVSDVSCEEGDEVIVFENSEQIKLLAGALNSISYEVLTNVSARVKRVYIQE